MVDVLADVHVEVGELLGAVGPVGLTHGQPVDVRAGHGQAAHLERPWHGQRLVDSEGESKGNSIEVLYMCINKANSLQDAKISVRTLRTSITELRKQ